MMWLVTREIRNIKNKPKKAPKIKFLKLEIYKRRFIEISKTDY